MWPATSNPNAERSGSSLLGKVHETGFPAVSEAVAFVVPRASRAAEVRGDVSNVIYQKCHVIRLFYVSDR